MEIGQQPGARGPVHEQSVVGAALLGLVGMTGEDQLDRPADLAAETQEEVAQRDTDLYP